MKRLIWTVAILAGLLAAIPVVVAAQEGPQNLELVSGWYQDRQVEYYDFGTNTPLAGNDGVPTQPIWVFIHGMNADGTPDLVEGQHNIIDLVPGEAGYTDLWQVIMVTVPDGYEPDSITSAAEVAQSGYETTVTDMLVNCPVVPAGTTLETGQELVQGWHDGEEIFYPDFGANPATVEPIWVLIHGMNADGTPDFVEGQHNIIDTVPGESDYTAFWRVNMVTVPDEYEADSLRSAQDVLDAGFEITETDMVVNCPVVNVASATSSGPSGVPAAGSGPGDTASSTWLYALIGGVAAIGALALGGTFAYQRNRR
jgi:hypothetical protein